MSSSHTFPTNTDIVSFAALHIAATIGPDHWHRTRPQQIQLSLQLHLTPRYLDASGRSDDVSDTLHYGHLAKAVERRVNSKAAQGYASARALIEDATDATFEFVWDVVGTGMDAVGGVLDAVRIVLTLPKQVLLAEGFEVELTTSASDWVLKLGSDTMYRSGAIVRVTNLILPVLIGVNPPERLAKQRVITDITFFESPRSKNAEERIEGIVDREVDYPAIIQQIVADVERATYFTLEKFVYEIIQTAYRAADAHPISNANTNASRIEAITVRCRKPSALSFADASGVEMTRKRE